MYCNINLCRFGCVIGVYKIYAMWICEFGVIDNKSVCIVKIYHIYAV